MLFSTAPAIVDPGDNTTTDIPEDGTRYFQVECDSFSNTVLVELHDNVGTSFLYCSATEKNPGPLTSNTTINDTLGITTRTCLVSLDNTGSKVCMLVTAVIRGVAWRLGGGGQSQCRSSRVSKSCYRN